MKRITMALFACFMTVAVGYSLTACKDNEESSECQHVYDNACDGICNECEEERTVVHAWQNADCDTPKTCTVCGATDGEAKGHAWKDADCDSPKTCTVCGLMQGVENGHRYTVDSYDDYYHFKACADCGEISEETAEKHVLDEEYTCECGCTYEVEILDGWEGGTLVQLYNEKDQLVKDFYYDGGELQSYTDYYFDENGRKNKEENYQADGTLSSYCHYTWNEGGKLDKFEDFNGDGTLSDFYVNTYDEDWNVVKTEWFLGDGSLQDYVEYEYDANGNCIKDEWFDAEGVCIGYGIYEYDKDGNQIKEELYGADGTLEDATYYEYDANGNCIKETYIYSDGSKCIYEYDENGNCIKGEWFDADGERNWYEIYEYDKDGNQIKEESYGADGTLEEASYYEYDENGNCIKETNVYEDGSTEVYEYDANGNRRKTETFDGMGGTDIYTYNEAEQYVLKEHYQDGVLLSYSKSTYEGELLIEEGTYDEKGNVVLIYVYDENGEYMDSHYASDYDTDCETPVICLWCDDYVFVEGKVHDFTGEALEDENGSYHICQNEGCTITDVEYSQQFKITGIVIIIDGVEYNRENTSLENPAVINEESIVEIKAFGKNLDSASPSSNKGVAYDENGYSPLHEDWNWVFNEDNTEATTKINASQFSIVLESLEITYCNDGRIWQGSGVYIVFEAKESDQK